MKVTTTDGGEYWILDFCAYCSLDTGGNHEAGCPCAYLDAYGALDNIHEIAYGKLTNWRVDEHKGENKLLWGGD